MLSGHGFNNNRPFYTSKPDTRKLEVHHQVLCPETAIDHDYKRLYGKQQNLRHLDPAMSDILAWGGADPPVKNDFTTDKGAFQLKYKINKLGVDFISEAKDNFRNPGDADKLTMNEQIVDYMQNHNQKLIKKKIYKNIVEKEMLNPENFTTEYRE